MRLGLGKRRDGSQMPIIVLNLLQAQNSARFARLTLSYWFAPSEGRRWYPRKQLHSSRYRMGGSPFSPQTRWGSRRGVKGVLSLWCLSLLLLIGSFPGQLEARASCWCSVVRCFLLGPSPTRTKHSSTYHMLRPLINQAIHPPTNTPTICYSSTVVRTAADKCVGSYSNFVRTGRYRRED